MNRLLKFLLFFILISNNAVFAVQQFDCGGIAASTGADITLNYPSSPRVDDILILQVLVKDQDDTLTVTGFTQLGTIDRSTASRYWWFWKRHDGTGTNILVDKSTATGDTYGRVCTLRGARKTGNFYEAINTPEVGTSDPANLTGITTLTPNSLVLVLMLGEDNNNSGITTTATNPDTFQEFYSENSTNVGAALTWSWEFRATAGATGTISVNWDVAVPIGWGGIVLAIDASGLSDGILNCENNSAVSVSSLSCTTTVDINIGDVHIVGLAKDNASTTNGNTDECVSVSDSAGNTYTKIYEHTHADGGANNGSTVCGFLTTATSQLASGGTVTVNFSDARTASAIGTRKFILQSGKKLTILPATVQTENFTDSTDAGVLTISGLSSTERLYLRLIGHERTTITLTNTLNFTTFALESANVGATEATSMALSGEFIIATSTGESSNPAINFTNTDGGSFFIAIEVGDETVDGLVIVID